MPCQDFPCGGSKCVWASSILVIVNEAIGADVGGVLAVLGTVSGDAVVAIVAAVAVAGLLETTGNAAVAGVGVPAITGNVFTVAVVGDESADDIELPPEPQACKKVIRLALKSTGETVFMCAIFDAQATVGEHLATSGRSTQMSGLRDI